MIVLKGEYCFGETMYPPLIVDRKDPKWLLLELVLTVTTTRRTKQEMAKLGITPVQRAGEHLRILIISLFFSMDCSFVIQELQERSTLRKFAQIGEVPTADQLYRFMSRFDEESFILLTSRVLNTICKNRVSRRKTTLLIDSTAIILDLNWIRKQYSKEKLRNREYSWGYSSTHGHYIGYKLTLIIEHPSLTPLAIMIHRGSPNDSRLFTEVMDELSRRRIIREGDVLVFDKGYYSYQHYADGIIRYKVVPLIFPRNNFKIDKFRSKFVIPLEFFNKSRIDSDIQIWKDLLEKLSSLLEQVDDYAAIRGLIEDVFKVAKNALSLKRLHRYTSRSVGKMVAVTVLLVGLIISFGYDSKKPLQRLSEW